MRLKIEEIATKNKILFIGDHTHTVVTALKKNLKPYHFTFFFSSVMPQQVYQYYAVFVFNDQKQTQQALKLLQHTSPSQNSTALIIFFVHDKNSAQKLAHRINQSLYPQVKIINTDARDDKETINKILWFAFSQSAELFLNFEKTLPPIESKCKQKIPYIKIHTSFILQKKKIVVWILLIFLFVEFFFIVPLGISSLLMYQSIQALHRSDIIKSKQYLAFSKPFFSVAYTSYKAARPVLSFLYLALIPDTIINIEENSIYALNDAIASIENSKQLILLILKIDKTHNEKNEATVRIQLLQQSAHNLTKRLAFLEQKLNYAIDPIPKIQKKIQDILRALRSIEIFLSHADLLLGKNGARKYLLLFENNMELRAGGGFIGSFGIVSFDSYTLQSLEVKDVYEADGQLKVHIEPPEAIATYLHQPHWFLRDSNFSPDFQENFEKAEDFLKKELNLANFNGGIALTTTALNTIIGAFGSVYIPDYQDTVTKDNFYIKAQTYTEKNFFPGSTQKKNFLSSLTRSLMLSLDRVSLKDLAEAIRQSLDDKQIVLYMKDEVFKNNTDNLHWNGKLIVPQCANNLSPCINDNIFVVDANLGVNKANFFISRLIAIKVKIEKDGVINNILSVSYKNDSPGEVFPGGTYKNYFQVYLPQDITVREITKNGTLVKRYETRATDHFTILAFYFEIPPQKTAHIKILYRLAQTIQKGTQKYQLVIQKQIGAINNDVHFELQTPNAISIISKNFPALAKERRLVYNTTLSSDKIFIIELIKE